MTNQPAERYADLGEADEFDLGLAQAGAEAATAPAGQRLAAEPHLGLREAIRRLATVSPEEELDVRNPDPDTLAAAVQNHGAILDAALIDALQQWLEEQS
jgi:hypothetical protein